MAALSTPARLASILPGELYSMNGPDYFDAVNSGREPARAVLVSLRTNAPPAAAWDDVAAYRLDVVTHEPFEVEEHLILEAMRTWGGSFVSELAALYVRADRSNRARLRSAFPHYFREYAEKATSLPKEGPRV